jgi:hypothetical protein
MCWLILNPTRILKRMSTTSLKLESKPVQTNNLIKPEVFPQTRVNLTTPSNIHILIDISFIFHLETLMISSALQTKQTHRIRLRRFIAFLRRCANKLSKVWKNIHIDMSLAHQSMPLMQLCPFASHYWVLMSPAVKLPMKIWEISSRAGSEWSDESDGRWQMYEDCYF